MAAIILQARLGSKRLPGKVLLPVLNKPLLEYLIERLKRALLVDQIICATTNTPLDDPIAELCDKLSIPCYRGDEDDVLSRYFHAAKYYSCNTIIRITGDCPLIDPSIIDQAIKDFLNTKPDYLSNAHPIRRHTKGMDVEIFTYTALERAHSLAIAPYEREHVTPHFYRNLDTFAVKSTTHTMLHPKLSLAVDTPKDFALIKTIIENLYPLNAQFSLEDILDFVHNKALYCAPKS